MCIVGKGVVKMANVSSDSIPHDTVSIADEDDDDYKGVERNGKILLVAYYFTFSSFTPYYTQLHSTKYQTL